MSNQEHRGRGYPVLSRLLQSPPAAAGALFDEHLQEFLLDTQCEGLAPLSVGKLHRMLMEFVHWLSRQRQRKWSDAQSEDLRAYLAGFVEASDSTAAARRWMLQRLYRWAHREELRPDNPAFNFPRGPALPRVPSYVPSVHQVERLLGAPDTTTVLGVRDRTVMEVLYATGMRAAEIVGLRMHQIDRKDRVIQVLGKGSRERLVIYGLQAADWLERYLAGPRSVLIHQALGHARLTDAVFVNPSRLLGMRYFHLRTLVRKHAQQAGLPLVTPHVIRHAFATHMQNCGMDLRTLQMLLGHAHLSTTTIYIRTRREALQELLEKHHPRGVHFARASPIQSGSDGSWRRWHNVVPVAR